MNASDPSGPAGRDQREALKDSERKASEQQPGSFKDEAMTDKVVEIKPIVTDDPAAIKGLDPK